jgi:flagellar basal-body rod protein FlgB
LRLALDGAALRHQAIAANIANASTPGHVPVKVDFEAALAQARDRLQAGADISTVSSETPFQVVADDGGARGLDEQAAALASNVVHYQALLRGLSKRMAILALAVNEGGRK